MNTLDILLFIGVVAAISGVSPTLISIFTSLMAGTLGKGRTNTRLWLNGIAFFAGFISIVIIIGVSFWLLLDSVSNQTAQYIAVAVSAVAIGAAIIEIKDYFWYGRGVSHKPHKRLHSLIHTRTSKRFGISSSFLLGSIAVAATASNIGLVTITVTSLLFVCGATVGISWFLLFGMCLLVGAFATLIAVTNNIKVSAVIVWKEESKAVMRLGSGLALIATAWLILLVLSHTLAVSL